MKHTTIINIILLYDDIHTHAREREDFCPTFAGRAHTMAVEAAVCIYTSGSVYARRR